jgi:hypothetical protein
MAFFWFSLRRNILCCDQEIAFVSCVNFFPLMDFIIQAGFLMSAISLLNESIPSDSYPRKKNSSNWERDLKILFSSG